MDEWQSYEGTFIFILYIVHYLYNIITLMIKIIGK